MTKLKQGKVKKLPQDCTANKAARLEFKFRQCNSSLYFNTT